MERKVSVSKRAQNKARAARNHPPPPHRRQRNLQRLTTVPPPRLNPSASRSGQWRQFRHASKGGDRHLELCVSPGLKRYNEKAEATWMYVPINCRTPSRRRTLPAQLKGQVRERARP